MTLIAAWITPKFRIIASDTKCTDETGISHVDLNCEKIFSSDTLSIGTYGGFVEKEKLQIIEMIKGNFPSHIEKISKTKIKQQCTIGSEPSHYIIVALHGEPTLLMIKGESVKETYLSHYFESIYSPQKWEGLFFSEQHEEKTNKIDFEYYSSLRAQFEESLRATNFQESPVNQDSIENLLINFYTEVYYNQHLQKSSIGGQISCVFSINNQPYIQRRCSPIDFEQYSMNKLIASLNTVVR